jgi:hypothetical protein
MADPSGSKTETLTLVVQDTAHRITVEPYARDDGNGGMQTGFNLVFSLATRDASGQQVGVVNWIADSNADLTAEEQKALGDTFVRLGVIAATKNGFNITP